jgi:hypothetical protein
LCLPRRHSELRKQELRRLKVIGKILSLSGLWHSQGGTLLLIFIDAVLLPIVVDLDERLVQSQRFHMLRGEDEVGELLSMLFLVVTHVPDLPYGFLVLQRIRA